MCGFERLRDLLRDPNASPSGIAPRAIRWDKIVALDESHHEGGDATTFFEPVDGGNVQMIQ